VNPIGRARRLLIAAVALLLALVLFHDRLAAAIVTRGDDVLRGGDAAAAIRLYERALRLDPGSTVAADRLAFHLALRHERAGARDAVRVATAALAFASAEPNLYADRALAELELRAWRAAEHDFGRAGALAHDARYDHLAARMALRASDRGAAKHYARRALDDDPSFAPARVLLRALP